MIFSFRLHQNSWQNKNRQTIRVGGLPLLRRRFYSVSSLTAHRREIFIPALGTVGSPLPGCQTHFGVVPDVGGTVTRWHRTSNDFLRWQVGMGPDRNTNAVIRVYHDAGNVIATHEYAGDLVEP